MADVPEVMSVEEVSPPPGLDLPPRGVRPEDQTRNNGKYLTHVPLVLTTGCDGVIDMKVATLAPKRKCPRVSIKGAKKTITSQQQHGTAMGREGEERT